MCQISEANGRIEFTKPMSRGLRSFVFFVGLFPFIAPYELLIRPGWQEFSLFMIIPIVVSVGAIAVGSLFLLAGILGMHQTLRFDAASRAVVYACKTAITSLREKHYNFADVVQVKVNVHNWESRPATYGLQVTFADGRKVAVGNFPEKDEAQKYLDHVESMVQ